MKKDFLEKNDKYQEYIQKIEEIAEFVGEVNRNDFNDVAIQNKLSGLGIQWVGHESVISTERDSNKVGVYFAKYELSVKTMSLKPSNPMIPGEEKVVIKTFWVPEDTKIFIDDFCIYFIAPHEVTTVGRINVK